MSVSVTIFRNRYDNKTHKRMDFETFAGFEELLYGLSKKRIYRKEKANLISPATYIPDTTRANVNVVDWGGWAALDVDDSVAENFRETLASKFNGLYFVCYSTASSTEAHPKFRLVFPLDKRVEAEKIPNLWYALNNFASNMGDTQVKDLSRMYYVPADYRTSAATNSFIFTQEGDYLPVESFLARYPMPEKPASFLEKFSPEIKDAVLRRYREKLTNDSVSWTSYHNCPFWPKNLEIEYRAITSTGWYHQMYRIMVSIATRALGAKYPITVDEIANLAREFDAETGGWYAKRPLEKEAARALDFAFQNYEGA
jgi:hypothetical protein